MDHGAHVGAGLGDLAHDAVDEERPVLLHDLQPLERPRLAARASRRTQPDARREVVGGRVRDRLAEPPEVGQVGGEFVLADLGALGGQEVLADVGEKGALLGAQRRLGDPQRVGEASGEGIGGGRLGRWRRGRRGGHRHAAFLPPIAPDLNRAAGRGPFGTTIPRCASERWPPPKAVRPPCAIMAAPKSAITRTVGGRRSPLPVT